MIVAVKNRAQHKRKSKDKHEAFLEKHVESADGGGKELHRVTTSMP